MTIRSEHEEVRFPRACEAMPAIPSPDGFRETRGVEREEDFPVGYRLPADVDFVGGRRAGLRAYVRLFAIRCTISPGAAWLRFRPIRTWIKLALMAARRDGRMPALVMKMAFWALKLRAV